MGEMVTQGVDQREAFQFILRKGFTGVVLTGTASRTHLRQNMAAFAEAERALRAG
jgi:hypothetical protein